MGSAAWRGSRGKAALRWFAALSLLCVDWAVANPLLGQPGGGVLAADAAGRQAAALEVGLPLLRNFSPKEYGARPQNWAVVQDQRGLIYVGNGDGVLEFDGLRWRLIRVSNETSARSLAVDASGRIHVGAIGEFGYLAPDAHGELRYVSQLERIALADRDFTDVRRIFVIGDAIYLYSDQRLFRLRSNRVDVWRPQVEFSSAFLVDSRVFVHEPGRGLLELVDDHLALMPTGEQFASTRVQVMHAGDDGAASPTLLVGTRSDGFFRFDGQAFQRMPSEFDAEVRRDQLYGSLALRDGRLLLATLQGGLFVVTRDGRLLSHLRKADGLVDDTVYAMTADREGGVWLALDRGIARIELMHPLSVFDERNGLDGSPLSLQRFDGHLYAGTNHGLFKLIPGVRPRFVPVAGIVGQCWDLLVVDDSLWIANSAGVHRLRGDRIEALRPSNQHALTLREVAAGPRRVFIGMLRGLASMRFEQGQWIDEGLIAPIKDQVRNIWSAPDRRLWLGTRSTGVLRLGFPDGWRNDAGAPPQIERFALADGLPNLNHVEVQGIDDAPIFLTHQGLYRFDEIGRRFQLDPRFADLFPGGPRWMQPWHLRADGSIWAGAKDERSRVDETGVAIRQQDGRYRWDARALQIFAGNTSSVIHDEGEVLWFGGPYGLVRHRLATDKDYAQSFNVLLRRVSARDGRVIDGGGGTVPSPRIAYRDNALRFEYAAASFDGLDANRFQVFLEGDDRGWSDWRAESYQDYSNLFEGNYRFQMRAQNLYGTISDPALFAFRVLPPWYRSGFAYLSYLCALVGAVLLLSRWRLGRLQQKRRALERVVGERTRQLATLGDIGREITAQLDLDAALETLYRQSIRVLDASVFGVGLYDANAGEIEFRLAFENGQRYPPYVRSMADKNQLAVWCIERRAAVLIGDYESEYSRYLAEADRREVALADGSRSRTPKSVMYVPLLRKGQVLGVLGVQSFFKDAFDASHLDILQTLAAYTASAVEHAHEHLRLARSHEELSATHQRLVETQQQLVVQEKMASLGQLVAGVAHEINTPLSVALTASTHLGQESRNLADRIAGASPNAEDLAAYAADAALATRMIETNLDRAIKLVRSFKQVSVDRTNDDRRSFDVAAYLHDLVQSLEPSWKRRPIQVSVQCDDAIRLDSFPGALGQVVTNLIQNALQHAFAGEQAGQLQLLARRIDASRIELVLSDDGQGIAPEHLPRIFDPFFTTQRGRGGTGLGLHITFNLVTQKLGGSIDVDSQPGRGSRFRIVLPRVAP